jgi:hypothetical protein
MIRSLIPRKLGRCGRCISLSARGTLASWVAAGAAYLLWPNPWVWGPVVLVAAGFTTLLLAHFVAFTAGLAVYSDGRPEATRAQGGPVELQLERRTFLRHAGLGLAAFGALLVGRTHVAYAAGGSYCLYRNAGTISGPCPNVDFFCLPCRTGCPPYTQCTFSVKGQDCTVQVAQDTFAGSTCIACGNNLDTTGTHKTLHKVQCS